MTKLIVLVTTTIGSSAGWWLGMKIGFMTAFMLSVVGFAIGMWYGRRWASQIAP